MRKVLYEWNAGITIGGKKISNLRYADDTLMLAANEVEMITFAERPSRISEEFGLQINTRKIKIIILDKVHNNLPHTHQVAKFEVVDIFAYFRSLLTNNGDCSLEINRTLAMAQTNRNS
ncbi:uncharacterized protein [Diabrotica undecimpunctata]|uniref:uncharacterized protein n=1 Tax=Diabrotica undecimpunctata TaxID=50387 RepID=UPI003B63FDC5